MERILAIDDDSEMRVMLQQTLAAAGYRVAVASDGREGVETHRANPADLIIVDLFMPNQEGLETIVQLRREFPAVKIMAMSGKPGAGSLFLSAAKHLGAVKTLEKPFQPDELLVAIREVLAAKP